MIRHVTVDETASEVNLGIDVGSVAILNRSTTGADVYARTDGETAVIDADDCPVIPAGARRTITVDTDGPTVVSLIASEDDVPVELEA